MDGEREGKEGEKIKMIAIDWLFLAGASSIVGVAILEKISGDYGFRWVGMVLKAILTAGAYGAGLYLLDVVAAVFL